MRHGFCFEINCRQARKKTKRWSLKSSIAVEGKVDEDVARNQFLMGAFNSLVAYSFGQDVKIENK